MYGLFAGAFLCGCAEWGTKQAPPPPATSEQIAKEKRYLEKAFFTDPCFARLRRSARELSTSDEPGAKGIYAVKFPLNVLVSDGFANWLHVTEKDRRGYLYATGGIAGWRTVTGPLPLWECLQDALSDPS
jgi:hypothetical protein